MTAAIALSVLVRFLDPVFSEVEVAQDIAYAQAVNDQGKAETLLLDVYQPKGDTAAARPAIVWIHGGSYRRMSKTERPVVGLAERFARRGYVTVSIDYRLRADESRPMSRTITECADDAAAALGWVRGNAARLRIDARRLAIGGESAGGGVSGVFCARPDGRQGIFAQALLWGGLYHPALPDVQPAIDAGYPPTVLVHGTADHSFPSSIATARKLEKAGVRHRLHLVEDGEHGLGRREDEYIPMVAGFFYDALHAAAPQSYEAECYSRRLRGRHVQAPEGYSGTGAVELGGPKSYLEWSYVEARAAGEHLLQLRYANRSAARRQCEILVNGAGQGSLALPPAGGWQVAAARVKLNAGTNTIRVVPLAAAEATVLDRMDLVPAAQQ